MKNNLSKIGHLFLLLCLSISFGAKASGFLGDTTKILADNTIKPVSLSLPVTTNVKVGNVVYPKSLEDNKEQTLEYIQKFSDKRRNYLINIYQKGKKFFPKIISVLNKYQLPEELKVLAALESGFNAEAMSRVGAVGYWQIMDEVAKEYGLKIAGEKNSKNKKIKPKDDRKNFSKSTLVAAKYLKDRSRNLDNDLLLIVASYNCGVGNVWSAMEKSHKTNPTFWDIKKYLPAETRNYVMNFITLNVIFKNYDKFVKNQLVFAPDEEESLPPLESNAVLQSVTNPAN